MGWKIGKAWPLIASAAALAISSHLSCYAPCQIVHTAALWTFGFYISAAFSIMTLHAATTNGEQTPPDSRRGFLKSLLYFAAFMAALAPNIFAAFFRCA